PADVNDGKKVLDLELMDRIHDRIGSLVVCGSRYWRTRQSFQRFEPGGPSGLFGTKPAARITLSTPATNPNSRPTISPHGELPSHRSRNQPIIEPTTTPATSSVESRRPRAIADESAAPCSF